MPGLQSLLASFVTTTLSHTRDGETVFEHPHTQARIALTADGETILELATYGWTVSNGASAPSFSVLPALQRTFPELQSQHPDQLAKLLTPDSVGQLIAAQPVEHRGRMARWLLGRSRSTGNTELAKWTRDACAELPIQADHPLAPTPERATYLQGPDSVARISGSELTGYKLLLVATSNGRTMLSSATTLDELWTPNAEWTTAQWNAYEQLLSTAPCDESAFAAHVNAPHTDAATHTQHLWAVEQGTAAYLGTATEDLRRRYRHTPSSQWLDSASAETGISLRTAGGLNRLIDLYMVEHLEDAEVLAHIVPAMREADSDFAELGDTALAAIWRSAYNPILNSVLRAADDKVRLRVGDAPPVHKSSVETMRGLLSSYYGESPIATLELAGKLHLVESVADLPPNLRDEIDLNYGRDRVSGLTYESNVYLVGANTAPDTVCSVFLHEVGEHAALHTMLGRDYGRIVQRFNALLAEGDTYAVKASMMVPNTTAPSNLNSENLAHLIQLAADDLVAKDGGQGGFDLGQRCIRDLRTWLYRTPLMRELEHQGELEDFKLDALDMATLAREAVDYYVADHQNTTTAMNQWDSKLDGEFVAELHKLSVEQRVQALQPLTSEQQVAYLYALGTMQAPDGHETLTLMADAIAEATNSPDEVTRLLANEVSALTLRLGTQSRAIRRLDEQGLFAAISGTDDPSSSVLTLIRAAEQGQWVAEHYQAGLGLTLREEFASKEAAIQILGQHHFPVQPSELDSVIARWGSAIAAEHRQLDSQAFQRWFAGSVTRYNDGTPMVMYHGTAKSFSKANGMFWASAATPADLRPEPAPAAEPTLPQSNAQFEEWFANSKIVDADGKPLTLYHGTSASFNAFKVSMFGAIGAGVYTTPNAGEAQIYGDRLIDLHANLVNPLIGTFAEIRAMQYANETSERFTERLIGLGYDGVATKDATGSFDYVVAFQPEQLKSASQNNGMYDRSNTDIRFRADAALSPTDTLAFKNWFEGSTITDAQGQPLVVYHGTGEDFTSFKAGPSYFSPRMDYSYVRNSDVVMPVYLNIRNPYRPASQQEIESIRSNPERYEELKAQGYDGMVWSMPDNLMKGASGWGNDLPQIVAFYPNQVKSAIGNAGSFDRASDDIRFKKADAAQTATPEFKRWFGDSKVSSSGGEPLVVYHGTADSFYEFKGGRGGFYFTDDKKAAGEYAKFAEGEGDPRVISAYLSIENPLILDRSWYVENVMYDGEPNWEAVDNEIYRAEDAGYDGLILRDFEDFYGMKDGKRIEGVYDQYIAFRPEQIKSAVGNTGSFDRASPDIRFDLNAKVDQTHQPAFQSWFGQSKVVDPGGKPLVVYHGTGSDITAFKPNSFWTEDPSIAQMYAKAQSRQSDSAGPNTVAAYLSLQNPFVFDDYEARRNGSSIYKAVLPEGAKGPRMTAVFRELERRGYDGVILQNYADLGGMQTQYVAFSPASIKSAIGNAGSFDRASDDIRFDMVGKVAQTEQPAFKNWFGPSQVVDADGKPLVVFHGTTADIAEFIPQYGHATDQGVTFFTSSPELASDYAMGGMDRNVAAANMTLLERMRQPDYDIFSDEAAALEAAQAKALSALESAGQPAGANAIPVYLSIRNPLVVHAETMTYTQQRDLFDTAAAAGHDGVIIRATKDGASDRTKGITSDVFAVFNGTQIKSAISNVGSFDPNSADIRFKMPPKVRQTEQPAFKNWFGQSQLVDDGGAPLILYHGTNNDFTQFDTSAVNSRFPFSFGFHFTNSQNEASIYADSVTNAAEGFNPASRFAKPPMEGGTVMPVYLRAENPLIINTDMMTASIEADVNREQILARLEEALSAGAPYDSVIIKRERGDEYDVINVIVFDPTQIKSAIGNVGSFDRDSADIRFANTGSATDSQAFERWFDESLVVGEDGKPLVVYHGSAADISAFNPFLSGSSTGVNASGGIFFSDNPDVAGSFAGAEGGNITPAYLTLANPLVIDANGAAWTEIQFRGNEWSTTDLVEEAKELGYNGLIIRNVVDDRNVSGTPATTYVAFYPGQIKSSLSNVGSYDRDSPDIRFKMSDQLPQTSLPTFRDWFVRSAVVTETGEPLVVYHGSHQDFTVFQQQQGAHLGFHFGNEQAANTRLEDTHERHFNNAEYLRLNQRASTFFMDLRAFEKTLEEKSANTPVETIIADAARQGREVWEIIGDYAYQPTPEELARRKELETRFKEASVTLHKYGEGSHINAFYLSIQRPLRLPDVGDWGTADTVARELPWGSDAETFEDIVTEIKQHGYDGIVYHNKVENMPGEQADSYIAFDPEQIKSAIGNVGTFDRESADVRFAFAGAGAATASRQLLASAKAAIEEGGDAEQIRQDTGWFQGSDDKWRFELDDSQLKARESWNLWGQNKSAMTFRAMDLIDHWPLFDAYPQLRYLSVTVEPGLPPDHGMFQPLDSGITVGAEPEEGHKTLSTQQLSALMHELQHAVQEIERFASGGSSSDQSLLSSTTVLKNLNATYKERKQAIEQSPEYAEYLAQVLSEIPVGERMRQGIRGEYDHGVKVAEQAAYTRFIDPLEEERLAMFDRLVNLEGPLQGPDSRMLSYRLLAGEVEARNVQARLHLSAPERMATTPQSTQDAPEESVYLWHEDEVRLASFVRARGDMASAVPNPSAKLRFAYSDTGIRSQMDALADFYTQSDEYQFEQYEDRERITDQLIEQLESNEQFLGMVLPVAFGYSALTQSAKQPGAWQVTALDANFAPLSDEGTQSKREALATFFAQFDSASAAAVISGTTADIQLTDKHPGLSKALKGSTLADEYAEMRQDVARYSQSELEADRALIMPVYLNAKSPFDADKLPSGSMKVGELRDELVRQAEAAGRHLDVMLIGSLVKTITKAARVEESGPYYRGHDFWANPTSFFGGVGAAALEQLFAHCGFDSIKLTERDHLTYGVFRPEQVKSATGNTGLFSANPDIRFSFAGSKALTSNVSRLTQAKQLAEQNEPADSIWRQTGWMIGTDSEWRFEIDDSEARVRGFNYETNEPEVTTTDPQRYVDWVDESMSSRDGVPLGQFYDHPELYAAYPQLAHLKVVAVERKPGETTYGSLAFYPSLAKSTLFVAAPYTLTFGGPTVESILSHEIQHAVQHIEGFGPGALSSDFDGATTTSEELKSSMRAYIEIHDQSKSLGCEPEKFAELSGHEPLILERIGTWRQQGNWESNVAWFRRSLMSPFELYFHEAGEVEARNTQRRLGMDAQQRASTFPLDTLDVESSLVRVSRQIRVFANESTGDETSAYSRADSAFEWIIKTHSWRWQLNDNAQLIHAGETFNLFSVQSEYAETAGYGEVYAVALNDKVVGSFLYGPADDWVSLNTAAMVHPDFRRQGIASAAYDAIERVTGQSILPSATNESEDAKAFWAARQASTRATVAVGDSNALTQWLRNSSTIGMDGKPTVFYHGTNAAFRNFDAARHRSILNSNYQGDAFHFSTSPAVASEYSTAARNQFFRQHDLFEAAEKVLPPSATQLLRGLVNEGHSTWQKYSEEETRQFLDTCLCAGIDINDLVDLSQHVEGSASNQSREDYTLFAQHHDCDLPDYIIDIAVSLGLADAVPTPIVMPVYLRCENTLYTDDRQQAREAQSKGYDSVCYSGEGLVDQEPEWMVFDATNIRSVFEFEQDAKVFMQEHNNPMAAVLRAPITPPATTQFDHWFEGSNCINQFGEPRLVFVQDNSGQPFNTFTDLNAASGDDKGRITPALLAIRSPFVVTDSAHISITDLNDKLGSRKAGLIVGELLRDGRLFLEDIMENPRCSKWLQQAGYDGAIYRNRDGENRYVTFDQAQAVIGTAVAPDLNGAVQWGQIPAAAPLTFIGDRARARQFTLSNQTKPHGHVVPMNAADQYLGSSDRLYVNHYAGTRLTTTSIAALTENPATSKNLRDFLSLNRKALAGKARIDDTFADHIRNLRQDINDARHGARADSPQANHHRVMLDKLSNALAWAIENSGSGMSFKGLVSEDLLQWNKPLSQQSPQVQKALSTLGIDGLYQAEGNGAAQLKTCNRYTAEEYARDYPDGKVVRLDGAGLTGRACYEELANDLGGSKQAAELLTSMGITGAQQSTAEVLLFKPGYNHEPLVAMAMSKVTPGALDADTLAIHDLGGVLLKGGVNAACKSLWSNQERALEVAQSAINLLAARQAQQGEFASPLAANDVHNKQQLAEARALQQGLMFTAIPSDFLPWNEPLSEQQLKTLAPVIQIDPAHALPGSAVFRLIAGRQDGIEMAKTMLSKAGFAGVCSEESTLAWGSGAEKVCRTVANDVPRDDFTAAPAHVESSRAMLSMSFA